MLWEFRGGDAVLQSERTEQGLYINVLYGAVLYFTKLHCSVLYFTKLHCTLLHCTALQCTLLHCTVLQCTLLHCTALQCTLLNCTVLQCTLLHCTVLHFTIVHWRPPTLPAKTVHCPCWDTGCGDAFCIENIPTRALCVFPCSHGQSR